MRFPIIKVYDKDSGKEHIVGTNIHDLLKINNGESISYFNYQNGEGTIGKGDYSFVGKEMPYEGIVKVEFVAFEELQKIYEEQCKKDAENEQRRKRIFEKIMDDF